MQAIATPLAKSSKTSRVGSPVSRRPDATLGSLRDMRDARQRNLEAAREKLAAMMSAQRQLSVEVENLEAKLKLVEVAEASSELQFDDSQLARCKSLMVDIRAKLDVAAKLANADTNFHDEIPRSTSLLPRTSASRSPNTSAPSQSLKRQ